ncbi:DUF1287 domain-containing protein [Bifidobacterium sp. SMA15]|uniref:DUF1287 domain-containing protein n=2 Tax=Bifidobacterium platyrrhinorum TaxID=2661628 RepID=A0A6L9ST09_9BIFI|nr:DUF1287 domain-containing protein [Bifidobacterium platyrrhinorum]
MAVLLLAALAAAGTYAARHLATASWRVAGDAGTAGGTSDGFAPDAAAGARYPKAVSPVDYNGNGVDDYADIVAGARIDAENRPAYDDGYYEGGYPPDDRGACTDLVWRAFRNAGYDLKSMVDADVAADPGSYAAVAPRPDPNIDFRRTGVLDVFFAKYGEKLTLDPADHAQWQGGDIVVFQHVKHIGIVSDKRDANGTAFVLHNMGQRQRENDYLAFDTHMAVTGHYRFDVSKVPQGVLRKWS